MNEKLPVQLLQFLRGEVEGGKAIEMLLEKDFDLSRHTYLSFIPQSSTHRPLLQACFCPSSDLCYTHIFIVCASGQRLIK